ncbi:hypothetical protein D3C76_1620280 [compost metagenome]
MPTDIIHLAAVGSWLTAPFGLSSGPHMTPTFAIEVQAPVSAVRGCSPVRARPRIKRPKVSMNRVKKVITESTTSCSSGRPS